MEKVSVKGVILDQVSDMPFILLQTEDKHSTISIGVGPAEATAIIMALEGIKSARPITHDLFVHFLKRHRFRVEKIEIYDMIESKYYAKLYYRKGFRRYKLELRPSDALALAVRLKTPIYIQKAIIDEQTSVNHYYESDKHYKGDSSLFNDRASHDFTL